MGRMRWRRGWSRRCRILDWIGGRGGMEGLESEMGCGWNGIHGGGKNMIDVRFWFSVYVSSK